MASNWGRGRTVKAWDKVASDIVDGMYAKVVAPAVKSKDVTLGEMTKMIKELQAENLALKQGGDNGASSSKCQAQEKEEAVPVEVFLKQFEKGSQDKVLERLQIKSLDTKTVKAKIDGLCLSKEKADKMSCLADELFGRLLRKTSKPETVMLQSKLENLTVQWGLKASVASGAQDAADYKILAKLLAVAMVLEQ